MLEGSYKVGPYSNGKVFDAEKEKVRLLDIARKTFSESKYFKATGLDPNNFVFSCERQVMDGELVFFFEIYTKSAFPTKNLDLIESALREVREETKSGGKKISSFFQLQFTDNPEFSKLVKIPIIER